MATSHKLSELTQADRDYLADMYQAYPDENGARSILLDPVHHASEQELVQTLIRLKNHSLIVAGSAEGEEFWLTDAGVVVARDTLGLAPDPVVEEAPALSEAPAASKRRAAAPTAPATSAGRVISVAPNPKRPGSASATRYGLWAIGMTAEQAIESGLTKADVAHDTKKGFVVFG